METVVHGSSQEPGIRPYPDPIEFTTPLRVLRL